LVVAGHRRYEHQYDQYLFHDDFHFGLEGEVDTQDERLAEREPAIVLAGGIDRLRVESTVVLVSTKPVFRCHIHAGSIEHLAIENGSQVIAEGDVSHTDVVTGIEPIRILDTSERRVDLVQSISGI